MITEVIEELPPTNSLKVPGKLWRIRYTIYAAFSICKESNYYRKQLQLSISTSRTLPDGNTKQRIIYSMNKLEMLLQETEIILADGAMGTMLFAAGLPQGELPQLWNLAHPDHVAAVHRQYLEAGSKLLLTNTFSANRFRMASHEMNAHLAEINRAGAQILIWEVQATGGQALVAGDIGPSGRVMSPYGDLTFDEAKSGFMEQAEALIEAGVDVVWIETMSDLEEVRAAFEAVREFSMEIPIITTLTFDMQGRTMMGVSPEQAVKTLTTLGASAVGGNCGKGPDEIISVIEKMHEISPDTILVAKANAGIPKMVNGESVYDASPAVMAEYSLKARTAGAKIIGACCGSTPAHLKAMAQALASTPSR
jgi:5-methyltetrahydrofolate--homocysteine methyltransferase